MVLTSGDKQVIANLRGDYKKALDPYTDETIARAWREFSLSDEYERHKDEPNLFVQWVEMIHGESHD